MKGATSRQQEVEPTQQALSLLDSILHISFHEAYSQERHNSRLPQQSLSLTPKLNELGSNAYKLAMHNKLVGSAGKYAYGAAMRSQCRVLQQ